MDGIDRTMHRLLFWAAWGVVITLVSLVVGCGTNVGGTISLAQARASCLAWDSSLADGENFNTLVLFVEVIRDGGFTEAEFVFVILPTCLDNQLDPDPAGCMACFTRLAAAVWP